MSIIAVEFGGKKIKLDKIKDYETSAYDTDDDEDENIKKHSIEVSHLDILNHNHSLHKDFYCKYLNNLKISFSFQTHYLYYLIMLFYFLLKMF